MGTPEGEVGLFSYSRSLQNHFPKANFNFGMAKMERENRLALGDVQAHIWTEGKTDWKHLKKAFERLGLKQKVSFQETEADIGDENLLKKCEVFSETSQPVPMIFIFDRDNQTIIQRVSDQGGNSKTWGNNVFSLAIPVPNHRKGHENICIELYYSDSEIRTQDSNGRRLFLSSEFNETSGNHRNDDTIHIANAGKLKGLTAESKTKIVDSQVFRGEMNIALPKSDFANYIYGDTGPFAEFSFEEFRKILDIVEDIITRTKPKRNIIFPDTSSFFNMTQNKEPLSCRLSEVFASIVSFLELTMQVFSVSTIRSYEDAIVNEPPEYYKKVKPIRKVISDKFTAPALPTLYELTRSCFHLIDEKAPNELKVMKQRLGESFTLGAIGELLDNLESVYPPDSSRPRHINKSDLNRSLFAYIFPEFSKYGNKAQSLSDDIENCETELNIDINIWKNALEFLVDRLRPILSLVFVVESLDHVDTSNNYRTNIRTYSDESLEISQKLISFEDLDEYESTSAVTMTRESSQVSFRLFPFLTIKDDKLYHYKRTRATGYEYYSTFDKSVCIEKTKKKFSHSVFKISGKGTQQSLFWAEVLPSINEKNEIKANIPTEGPVEFVGRRKQIATIKREIIEIPNQNGIVYGVGGVGKTALMIQLSKELFEEEDPEKVVFRNIIWASAKSNYYNPFLTMLR